MFNIFAYLRCKFGSGHDWTNSKSKRGYMTCQKCRVRRKWR